MSGDNLTQFKTSIINILGDNYNPMDEKIIEEYINDYLLIASSESNRKLDDKTILPYVKKAVISAYLTRGKEGTKGSSEGGLSDTYVDIEDKLRKDARSVRIFVL